MRPLAAVGVILLVSYIAAAVITPPDPISCVVAAAAIFLVAAPSYLAGRRQGRVAATENRTMRNA